jgi:hypothetical protein
VKRRRVVEWMLPLGVLMCLGATGCGRGGGGAKATFPVRGEVYVDGRPADALAVRCTDLQGVDADQPTLSATFTDDAGKFALSTYRSGDGVPQGEYVLTFEWGKWNFFSGTYGGPDKLKGRYRNPDASEFRVSVTGKGPVDLGRIELSSSR